MTQCAGLQAGDADARHVVNAGVEYSRRYVTCPLEMSRRTTRKLVKGLQTGGRPAARPEYIHPVRTCSAGRAKLYSSMHQID